MSRTGPLPNHAGVSLKPEHYRRALECKVGGLWFEVHPENYMVAGGPRLDWLAAIRADYGLSFHGVGASLGGLEPFDTDHLTALRDLIDRFEPHQVSEHAVWSSHRGRYFADLLPLPRTREALTNLADRIDEFQTAIGRRILIENPSNYLPFTSELDEPDFLSEVARRGGCGLLLDVNNVYVSANNTGIDAAAYIRALPRELIGEIHIAGHEEDPNLGARLLIDGHGTPVSQGVWDLLDVALEHTGPVPVLLERDANIPPFDDLIRERRFAEEKLGVLGKEAVHALP